MKEIDLRTLEVLIEEKINYVNWVYILLFIGLNILIAVVNWLLQKNLKNGDNRLHKKKIREDKRLLIIEDIFKELVSFTYILSASESLQSISKTSALERKVSENGLYISNTLKKKIVCFLDYTKEIAADFRKKDFKKETQLLESIKKEFNK